MQKGSGLAITRAISCAGATRFAREVVSLAFRENL
jgi:hypothetical protein